MKALKIIISVLISIMIIPQALSQCNLPYQTLGTDGITLNLCSNPIFSLSNCLQPGVSGFQVCGKLNGLYQNFSSTCQACKAGAEGYYFGVCSCNNLICQNPSYCWESNCIDPTAACVNPPFPPCVDRAFAQCLVDEDCNNIAMICVSGVCSNVFPKQCSTNDQCKQFQTCSQKACVPNAGPVCNPNYNNCRCPLPQQICINGICHPIAFACDTGTCPAGRECLSYKCKQICGDTHCQLNQQCRNNTCFDYCLNGLTCKTGYKCENNLCLVQCPASSGVVCKTFQSCVSGVCMAACSATKACPTNFNCDYSSQICIPSKCDILSPCPSFMACNNINICEKCTNGIICVQFCVNKYCALNQQCYNGNCIAKCLTDDNCKLNYICIKGNCVTKVCTQNTDCVGGAVCLSNNICGKPCSQITCNEGYECVASSCKPISNYCSQTIKCQNQQYTCISNKCVTDNDNINCDNIKCDSHFVCWYGICVDPCKLKNCPNGSICKKGNCVQSQSQKDTDNNERDSENRNQNIRININYQYYNTYQNKYANYQHNNNNKKQRNRVQHNYRQNNISPSYCNQYIACLGNCRCINNQCVQSSYSYNNPNPQYCHEYIPCPRGYYCKNFQCELNQMQTQQNHYKQNQNVQRYCNQYTDCGINFICINNQCVKNNQNPIQSCNKNIICPFGLICQNNLCVAKRIKCSSNSCPPNYSCVYGLCQSLITGNACSSVEECKNGQICVGNVCRSIVCFIDSDCFGYICSPQGKCK